LLKQEKHAGIDIVDVGKGFQLGYHPDTDLRFMGRNDEQQKPNCLSKEGLAIL
jgi:hypothetical protein